MKINGKSIALSLALLLIFLAIFYASVAMYFSGPNRAYEAKVTQKIEQIQASYSKIDNIKKTTFFYITYIGEDETNYVWFNDKAKAIDKREKSTFNIERVKIEISNNYGIKSDDISLGYGYNNPTYIIKYKNGVLTLDYDTFKEIYHEKR